MKNLEVRTRVSFNIPQYKKNLKSVILFLRHDEDKIVVRSYEQVELEVYDNGKLIFSGDKHEFYKKLKA